MGINPPLPFPRPRAKLSLPATVTLCHAERIAPPIPARRTPMNRTLLVSALALSSIISLGASAAATVGQAAPEITLTDVDGKTVHLSDFKGKHVVLEWNNPACPFVKKHYESG